MDTAHAAFATVALTGRAADLRVAEAMLGLAAHLLERGRHVRAVAGPGLDFGLLPVSLVPEEELARHADLLVAIGGDGTMLHAARMAAAAEIPVLGINHGRLGFLSDVGPNRMLESLDDALEGRCLPETRMLLEAYLQRDGPPRRTRESWASRAWTCSFRC